MNSGEKMGYRNKEISEVDAEVKQILMTGQIIIQSHRFWKNVQGAIMKMKDNDEIRKGCEGENEGAEHKSSITQNIEESRTDQIYVVEDTGEESISAELWKQSNVNYRKNYKVENDNFRSEYILYSWRFANDLN